MIPRGPIIVDLLGKTLLKEEEALLLDPACGGVIFFSRNYESPSQIAALIKAIKAVRPNLLLMVDQEGGPIMRFRDGFTNLPSPKEISDVAEHNMLTAMQMANSNGETLALELGRVGMDMTLAPVVDVDQAENKALVGRTYGKTHEQVKVLGTAFCQGLNSGGMGACLKHFPTHGGLTTDTHVASATDTRSKEDLQQDWEVFKHIMEETDVTAVMPAHIVYPSVDPDHPAGMSAIWLQDILRKQMGFTGWVFSDCMSMKAAVAYGDIGQRSNAAMKAGCDFVLVCNDRPAAIAALEAVRDNLEANEVHRNQDPIPELKARRAPSFHI